LQTINRDWTIEKQSYTEKGCSFPDNPRIGLFPISYLVEYSPSYGQ
jgi:hypothetical protein